jgi:hypothetical protein
MADPFAPFPAVGGEPVSSNDMRYPLIPWAESLLGVPFNDPASPIIGAFGQLVAQEETPIVTIDFPYNINTAYVTTATANGGTVTQADSQAVLQTSAAANGSASIDSIIAARYLPGQGKIIRFTAIFTPGVADSIQIQGAGDDDDGYFFGYQGTVFGIFRRQNGSDFFVAQADWNTDTFDGSGDAGNPSGALLDQTKGNVYQIKYQWLGYGAIRYYIEDPLTGVVSQVHVIQYANANIIPSVFNPSFQLHAEVENLGNTSNITLITASMGLYSEGPVDVSGARFSTGNRKTGITTETNIFTLQNKTTFQSKTNRGRMHFDSVGSAIGNAIDSQYRLVLNATLGGSPVFNDISVNQSIAAVDVAGTTVTGGREIRRGPSTGNFQQHEDISTLEIRLNPGDTLTFAASSFGTAVIPNLTASWREEL